MTRRSVDAAAHSGSDKPGEVQEPSILADTTAVILAGGLGTRLKPAVNDRPKPLAPINGRPFLDYQIARIAQYGIREIVLCVGYQAQAIVDALGGTLHGARLRYLRDWPLRGTGGALRNALSVVDSASLLVINGDSFSNADLTRFAAGHKANADARCTMLLAWRDCRDDFGAVTLDKNRRIAAIREKQPGTGAGYVNAGVYLLDRTVLAGIPADRSVSFERDALPRLVGRGLFGWTDEAAFIDIGTPENYARAHAFMRKDAAA